MRTCPGSRPLSSALLGTSSARSSLPPLPCLALPCLQGMDPAAAALLLRLFQRRGPWFRAGTLSYAEVPDVGAALGVLCTAGMARVVHADGSASGAGAAAATADPAAGGAEPASEPTAEGPAQPPPAAAAAMECDSLAWCSSGDASGRSGASGSGSGSVLSSGEEGWEESEGEGDAAGTSAAVPQEQQLQEEHGGAAAGQQAGAWAGPGPPICWAELASLLTVPELAAVLASLERLAAGSGGGGGGAPRPPQGASRAQLLEALGAHAARGDTQLRQQLLAATGEQAQAGGRLCRGRLVGCRRGM